MKKIFFSIIALLAIALNMSAVIPPSAKAIDLGLPSGTLWANMNIGATSPEQYGDYFAWGETAPKNIPPSEITWDNYKYFHVTYEYKINGDPLPTKYIKYSKQKHYGPAEDNKTELEPEDDAAYVNWGSEWRIPSLKQIKELIEKCTWTDDVMNGVPGFKVTGPNGNSIFLPPADCSWWGFPYAKQEAHQGTCGRYWSRDLAIYIVAENACCLKFDIKEIVTDWEERFKGLSIRPVKNKK